MTPFDTSNPLTLTEITTGNEPNVVTFEVPINYNLLSAAGGLTLNINGIDVTLKDVSPAPDGNALLNWNSTYDAPGQLFLQAQFGLSGQAPDNAIISACGLLYPFLSTNMVQFFEAGSMFTDVGAFLDASLFTNNADYIIDLYDPSNTPATWISSIIGSTDSGMILEDWGVTNADGTPFTGTSVEAVFNILPAGTLSSANGHNFGNNFQPNAPRKTFYRAAGSLSEWGPNFDVAYMYMGGLLGHFPYDNGGVIWNGMQGVVDTLLVPLIGGIAGVDYYNSSFNYDSYGDQGECPYGWGTSVGYPGYIAQYFPNGGFPYSPRDLLKADLASGATKSFYCYSHGWPNPAILSSSDPPAIESQFLINLDVLGSQMGNQAICEGRKINNPYRFVFLDACSMASTRNAYQDFGIVPTWFEDFGARTRSLTSFCWVGKRHR